MSTTFHLCAICPNQACRCPIPLGCLEEEGCCRVPGDLDRYELFCRRCGTRFELVADTLARWPVITTQPLAPLPEPDPPVLPPNHMAR